MKILAIPALVLGLAVAPAAHAADPVCAMMGDAVGNAAAMRAAGATQHETARAATNFGSAMINKPEVQASFTNQERRAFAQDWGYMASRMIQLVYSMPKKHLSDPAMLANITYELCTDS